MENNEKDLRNGDVNNTPDNTELDEILYGADYADYREDMTVEETDEKKDDDRLSTFAVTEEIKKKPKSTVISKQTKLIILLSSIFAVILILFFVLGPTGFDVFGFNEQSQEYLELIEGEVALGPTRHLVFEHLERDEIQQIEVHNQHGTYTAYYNNEVGDFCFLGAEDAIYDDTLFSSLVVNAGYTIMQDRLSHEERSADYSEYGLGEDDDPAYYIISSRDGKSKYKMYIGNATLDNSGYYAMLDGRDEIYVLSANLSTTLLADVKTLFTALLTYPISDNEYYTKITDFYISRDSEAFVKFSYVGQTDDKDKTGVTIPYVLTYPKDFPGSTTQIQALLASAVNLTGDEILELEAYNEIGKDEEGEPIYELKPEYAEKYGLDEPAYDMFYYYTENKLLSFVTFSEKQTDEDGNEFYSALSQTYNTIVKINAEKGAFLEWEIVDYIERAIFNYHIDYVSRIEMTTEGMSFDFNLTGSGDKLNVTEKHSNRILKPNPEGMSEEILDDIYNFRQFYKTSLTIVSEDFTETPVEKAQVAEMTVTLRSGDTTVYTFYSYSDRRCYYTVNGEGEFYIARSMVKKLFNDAQKVIDKIPVDSEAES